MHFVYLRFWLTHTGKCAERFREHRAGSLAFLPGVFGGSGVVLHHLGHEISHSFRRLILHLPGGVGVGTEGETCVIVAQHTGNRLDIHAVLEGQGGEGVPLRYNNDKPENPSNDGRFEGLSHLFHSFSNHEKAGQKS